MVLPCRGVIDTRDLRSTPWAIQAAELMSIGFLKNPYYVDAATLGQFSIKDCLKFVVKLWAEWSGRLVIKNMAQKAKRKRHLQQTSRVR